MGQVKVSSGAHGFPAMRRAMRLDICYTVAMPGNVF